MSDLVNAYLVQGLIQLLVPELVKLVIVLVTLIFLFAAWKGLLNFLYWKEARKDDYR